MSSSQSSAAGVQWDLSALYSSTTDPKIDAAWAAADSAADKFASTYRGKVETGELSPADLSKAITELEEISTQAVKAPTYAHLLFAADASNPETGAFMQAQMEKSSALRIKMMFFELELQAAPQEWIDACLADPALANYKHYVTLERVYAKHTLTEEKEVLLEETANTGIRAWTRLHDEVLSAQKFNYVNPETKEESIETMEQVLTRFRAETRAERQAAADCFTEGIEKLEKVIVFIYNTILADKSMKDRLRSFETPEQSRHLSNELDQSTVDIVMDLCREQSDMVARYYKVKKSILGLDELTHVDRYAPLFDATAKADYATGKEIVLDAFGAFSKELADGAEEFFDNSWIDAEPREGKTGGAFCSYNTPDTHPVILMSYMDKLSDVMTLAHELGHGVHASVSRGQTSFNFQGTLPLAELASIFGEMLVFEKITAAASTKDKTALYAEKIEGIFASVHRQAAMFRFEQKCHAQRRASGELAPEQFQEIWQDEQQSMFGDGVTLGEQHKHWWLYVSHFFQVPFYVYAYSFGELLTLSLYQKANQEGEGFAEKYLDVLKLGGSEDPQALMGRLGVDLGDRAFWEGGFAVIDEMTKEFERLWAECQAEAS
jgi:oligoendopeptidase F